MRFVDILDMLLFPYLLDMFHILVDKSMIIYLK